MTELQIRLAYERGLLTQKKITSIQNWALAWYLSSKKVDARETRDVWFRGLLAIVDPVRYQAIYEPQVPEGEVSEEYGVSDFDDIDKYLKALDRARVNAPDLKVDEGWV